MKCGRERGGGGGGGGGGWMQFANLQRRGRGGSWKGKGKVSEPKFGSNEVQISPPKLALMKRKAPRAVNLHHKTPKDLCGL